MAIDHTIRKAQPKKMKKYPITVVIVIAKVVSANIVAVLVVAIMALYYKK